MEGARRKEGRLARRRRIKKKKEGNGKSDGAVVAGSERSYEEQVALMSVVSKPVASRGLAKSLYKAVRNSQQRKQLRRGVREVVKALRKEEKGIVVLAGDVSPIDVITHIPVYCEEREVPYCFVPSRVDLGAAAGSKRPTSVVLIQPNKDYQKLYQDCYSQVDGLPLSIS